MEINHLKYVYEVARLKSFTKAAKSLRISQPGISRAISQIEEHYNSKLFDRTKKGLILTRMGQIFLSRCENIFKEIENLKEEVGNENAEFSGVLRLAASDNLCNYILPPLLYDFWKVHNKVLIKLHAGTSETIKEELLTAKSELGIFYTQIKSTEIELEKIKEIEFIAVCSPANQLLADRKNILYNLNHAYCIGSRPEEYREPNPAMKLLASVGVKPKQFFEVNNHETQKKMAMQPWGYTLLPRHSVEDELNQKKLSEIHLPKKLFWPVYLAKMRNRTLSRTAEIFETFLLRQLKK